MHDILVNVVTEAASSSSEAATSTASTLMSSTTNSVAIITTYRFLKRHKSLGYRGASATGQRNIIL